MLAEVVIERQHSHVEGVCGEEERGKALIRSVGSMGERNVGGGARASEDRRHWRNVGGQKALKERRR